MNPRQRCFAAAITFASLILAAGCSSDKSNPAAPQAGGFDSGNLNPGALFEHAFPDTGTFSYHCNVHRNMVDAIRVASGGRDTLNVRIVSNANDGFVKQTSGGTSVLKPGGLVRWTNGDTRPHTVTSD